jgi:excisionase family DNA binding protein
MPKPLTPDLLADRWQVSAETIRQLVRRGELRAFKVGRMFRIPMEVIEEYEACQITGLDDSMGDSLSHGTMNVELGGAIVLTHTQLRRLKAKR